MSLNCLRAPFLSRFTSFLTVCLWVSVLPSVTAENVTDSDEYLKMKLFLQYRWEPAFKAVMDMLPKDYFNEEDRHQPGSDPRTPGTRAGWFNYSASIFDGWGHYLERGIILFIQGLITIILIVCLFLTIWWFFIPLLSVYLRAILKVCMISISIFAVARFLY